MSRKRRNTSSPEPDDSPPPKKQRSIISYDDDEDSDDPHDINELPRFNPAVGASNAFPGLGDGDELFYGPAANGIDYLRMVRSEAKSVPDVLVSKSSGSIDRQTENVDEEYEEGVYFDGTYTGAATDENTTILPVAQQQYYQSLLERFYLLRGNLRRPPSAEAIAALGESRPITLPSNSRIARDAWERHMLNCDPHPVQAGSLDSETVMELVTLMKKRLDGFLGTDSGQRSSRIASWVWAILARCPDRGELGGEEIAELRAFASRAAALLRGKDEARIEVEDEAETEDEEDLSEIVREALMARVETQIKEAAMEETDASTRILSRTTILDAIITVIGEVYGQRDLLEKRQVWVEGGLEMETARLLERPALSK